MNIKNIGIKLIIFNGSAGIIRCNLSEKDNMIKILNSIRKIKSLLRIFKY